MALFYLLAIPILATIKATVHGRVSKSRVNSASDVFLLNGLIFTLLTCIISAVFVRQLPTLPVLGFCLLRAALTVSFQVIYSLAFKSGPISLTTLLTNFNIVVALIYGVLVYDEKLSLLNFIGLLLCGGAFVLIPAQRKEAGGKGVNAKWLIFVVFCILTAGGNNILNMVFPRTQYAPYNDEYVAFAYIFSAIICFVVYFARCHDGGTLGGSLLTRSRDTTLAICGIIAVSTSLGFHSIISVRALATVDAVLLYPVTGVLGTIFTVLVDVFVNKQRFSLKQVIGIFAAALAVLLLNI